MTTQDTPTIPISSAPDNFSYRLLELPSELHASLTSPSPPVLFLTTGSDGLATLKSPSHTYTLRQRNTSNSLILVSPSDPTTNILRDEDGDVNEARPVKAALTAFATVHEAVEMARVQEGNGGVAGGKAHTGSRGKWHEKFGRGR